MKSGLAMGGLLSRGEGGEEEGRAGSRRQKSLSIIPENELSACSSTLPWKSFVVKLIFERFHCQRTVYVSQ